MSDKELIAEARQEASIHDKLGDGFSEGSEERAFYYGHRDRYKRLADALEVATCERDAALAAIERVRAINTGNNRALYGNDFEAGMAKALWLVKAALDGAPEPEWEYGMQDDYGLSYMRNIEEARDHTKRQRPELNPRVVRRRKAGPWLPVEGESTDA